MAGSILSITVAGALAAIAAWWIVGMLGLTGVPAGVVAVLVAMVVGLAVFAIGVRLFKGPPPP
jgi:hypothetical protein